MRTLLMATTALAMTASGAEAQRVVRSGPAAMRPAPAMARPVARPAPVAQTPRKPVATSGNWGHGQGWNGHGSKPGHGWGGGNHPKPPRWGGHVGGRWWGGWRAPGGWGAYRRPVRGFILPGYWISPNWYVNDWGSYGLPTPPEGYNWSRYYDDAVLIDGRGSVYDTIGGVNWDGSDGAGTDYAYADGDDQGGYDESGYADGGYSQPGAPYAYPQRDSGLGGAAVGAVVGGVAGNAIAGRGDRLAGTVIGAGVGAAAGYAIDRSEDRGRYAPPPPPHGVGYPPPPHGAGYPPPPPHGAPPPPRGPVVVQSPGYYANGYYYPGATVTTVTVSTAPVVTTTTEVFEDSVTYTPRRAWRHRTWRAKPKPKCSCS